MYGTTLPRAGNWGLAGMGLAEASKTAGAAGGRFFTLEQRARMKGGHLRQQKPAPGKMYMAGVALPRHHQRQTSHLSRLVELMAEPVTVSVAEIEPGDSLRIVEHYRWAQQPDGALIARLNEVLWGLWGCRKVLVDGVAGGDRVLSILPPHPSDGSVQLVGEAAPRSAMGLGLLTAVDGGRVTMYADDGSAKHREFWAQAVRARVRTAEGGPPDFYVEPSTGDDGFLRSLALAVEAARAAQAIERLAEPIPA